MKPSNHFHQHSLLAYEKLYKQLQSCWAVPHKLTTTASIANFPEPDIFCSLTDSFCSLWNLRSSPVSLRSCLLSLLRLWTYTNVTSLFPLFWLRTPNRCGRLEASKMLHGMSIFFYSVLWDICIKRILLHRDVSHPPKQITNTKASIILVKERRLDFGWCLL